VFEQPWTEHVQRNLAVLVSSGAKLWPARTRVGLGWAWLAYHTWRRPPVMGTFMAAGASTPLGCFGFVEAGLELAAQIEAGELPRPDVVYVTAGSAGSCAGLLLGLALANVRTHVYLVSSVERWAFNRVMLRRMLAGARRELLARGLENPPAGSALDWISKAGITIAIDHGEVGGGYGSPTPAGVGAAELASLHGITLETTYTAKCLAALRRVEALYAGPPRNVLLWNTHGGNDLRALVLPDWRERCPFPVPSGLLGSE
jgi:D-cysteine desulfhydrase